MKTKTVRMDGKGGYYVKQNKSETEIKLLHLLPNVCNLKKIKNDWEMESGLLEKREGH